MKVFPLSVPAKIILFIIAIMLGIIWARLAKPQWFKKKEKGGEGAA